MSDTDAWKCLIIPDCFHVKLQGVAQTARAALEALLLVKAWCRARVLFEYRLVIAILERIVTQDDGYVIAFAMSVETSAQASSTFVDDIMDLCDLLREPEYVTFKDLKPYLAEMQLSAHLAHRRAVSSLDQLWRFSKELGKICARLPHNSAPQGISQGRGGPTDQRHTLARIDHSPPDVELFRKAIRDFGAFTEHFSVFVDWWSAMKSNLQNLQGAEEPNFVKIPLQFAAARDQWRRVKDRYTVCENKMKVTPGLSELTLKKDPLTVPHVETRAQTQIPKKPSITAIPSKPHTAPLRTRHHSLSSHTSWATSSETLAQTQIPKKPSITAIPSKPHAAPLRTRHHSLSSHTSWATSSETLRTLVSDEAKRCSSFSSLSKPDNTTAERRPHHPYPLRRISSLQDFLPLGSIDQPQLRRHRRFESEETLRNLTRQSPPSKIEYDSRKPLPRPNIPKPTPPIEKNVGCLRQFLWGLGFRRQRRTKLR